MNILLFGYELNQCKTAEEKAALCAQYPEFARRVEENMARHKKRMEGFDKLPPLPVSKSIDVLGKLKIGTLIKHEGHQYRVVSHFSLTPLEAYDLEESNDVFMPAGDYSHAELVEESDASC